MAALSLTVSSICKYEHVAKISWNSTSGHHNLPNNNKGVPCSFEDAIQAVFLIIVQFSIRKNHRKVQSFSFDTMKCHRGCYQI